MLSFESIINRAQNVATSQAIKWRLESVQIASDYAEPGYYQPKNGIVFANWNRHEDDSTMERLSRIFERAGYVIEWSDEWSTCGDCGRAVRVQPDSYSWQPYFDLINDSEIVCLDCLTKYDHIAREYLENLEDKPGKASRINPREYGYVELPETYETGFHPGQDSSPKNVLALLHKKGYTRIVFRITSQGQFGIEWKAYFPEREE